MRYTVSIAVDGRLNIEVCADSPAAARVAAETEMLNYDLNRMDDITLTPVEIRGDDDSVFRLKGWCGI